MIDEKKLMKEILYLKSVIRHNHSIDEIIKLIKKQEVVGEWIPCSKQMPPKPKEYDMSEKSYIVKDKYILEPYTAFWDGEKWTNILDDVLTDIIAWMPLPEYYKE